jgi:hypothetical protein
MQPRRRRRKRDYVAPSIAVLALLLVVGTYFYRARHAPALSSRDSASLRRQLLEEIPSGTRLTDAIQTMRARGFQCEQMKSSVWGDAGPLDFLYCDRDSESSMGAAVRQRWQVAIVQDKGSVKDVLVESGLVGP